MTRKAMLPSSMTKAPAMRERRGKPFPCEELRILAGAAIATGLLGTVAAAAAAEDEGEARLEEIIVTAQKRSERLLDVPMSIAALSDEQLTESGINSALDLGQVAPGLLATNVGTGFTPSIRGVSSSGTSVGDEANVATYIDDVYRGDTLSGFFDLPDIESVEVLKGPQGTLFGRNATGGAIRVTTRGPSFTPVASFTADYGFDFGETKLSAFVAGPVGDQVAASLSVYSRSGDGFVEGVGPNEGREYAKPDNQMYRGKVLFKLSDTFEFRVAADFAKNDNTSGALPTAKGQNPFPGSIPNTPYHFAGVTQPMQVVETYSGILDATWEASDWMTIRSITGYRDFQLDYQVDIDRTSQSASALTLQADQQNFSQEFNFFGPADQTVTWLVGVFYYGAEAGNPYFRSFVGDAPTGPVIAAFRTEMETTSWAGFADVTWHATSQLHATLGARYTEETKEYHYLDLVRPGGLPPRDVRAEETWDSPTYRGVLRYDLSDDANVYLSLSNGFKSGVFNAFSPLPIPVEPEEIDALEIGTKARFDNGLVLTASAYAYNYDDLQVQAQTLVAGVPLLTLSNAASAEIRGADFTLDGNLTDKLSFGVGANWLPTAEYSDYETAAVTVPVEGTAPIVGRQIVPYDASGSRIIKAPEWMASLRLTYTTPMMGGEFVGTIHDAYNSGFNWQAGDYTEEPSYNVVNMRLAWTDPSDRYTFSLWATNLTDEEYSTYTTPNVRGDTETWSQPRQIGVGFAANF